RAAARGAGRARLGRGAPPRGPAAARARPPLRQRAQDRRGGRRGGGGLDGDARGHRPTPRGARRRRRRRPGAPPGAPQPPAAALGAVDDPALVATWRGALARLDGAHGLLAGRAVRLLLDGGALDRAEAARRAGLALSAAEPPERAGAWAEGFLGGSAALLLHDETLWQVVDGWLAALD